MMRVVSVGRSHSLLAAGALGFAFAALAPMGCAGSLDPSQFPTGSAGTGSTGTAGSSTSGTSGAAGTTGTAGMASGTAGTAGVPPLPSGCDPVTLLTMTYNCSVMSVCHDANGSAANLNMTQANWKNLVGALPSTAKAPATQSICAQDPQYKTMPYIMKGSATGDGLILRKLMGPVCSPGGAQMPSIPGPITVMADLTCIEAWATQLAAGGTGTE